jgi:hypothetical protein
LKWFLRICLLGLCITLLIWAMPDRFKPYRVSRVYDDWKIRVQLRSWEDGLGPSGFVLAHFATSWEQNESDLLDPMRRECRIALTQPAIPHPINTDLLQWDEWGPNSTLSPTRVSVYQWGAIYSIPYSIIAIAFSIPLVIRAMIWFRRWFGAPKPPILGSRTQHPTSN